MRRLRSLSLVLLSTLSVGPLAAGCAASPEPSEPETTTESAQALAYGGHFIDYARILNGGPGLRLLRKDTAGNWRMEGDTQGYWGDSLPNYGGATAVPTLADYDGDGIIDLSVKDPSNFGTWYIDYSTTSYRGWDVVVKGYGTSSTPVPGYYDDDRLADIAVRSSDGYWLIDYAKDGFRGWDEQLAGYGTTGAVAPADYDGDGKTDISVKDAVSGIWYIDKSSDGYGKWNVIARGYGGQSPLPGDYDGDGMADLAVHEGTTLHIDYAKDGFGTWDLIDSRVALGAATHLIVADVDLDKKADLVEVVRGDTARDGWRLLTALASRGWKEPTSRTVEDRPPSRPAAPSNVRVTPLTSSLIVQWNDNSNNEEGFVVRYTHADGTTGEKKVDTNTKETTVYGLTQGARYCVTVRARNWGGESDDSPEVCATIQNPMSEALPDLFPRNVFLNPLSPEAGQRMSFNWEECNLGTAAAGAYRVRVLLDGREVRSIARSGLAIGCFNSEVVSETATSGAGTWRVELDSGGQVRELNESNNVNVYGF